MALNIAVLIFLFLTTTVAAKIGIEQVGSASLGLLVLLAFMRIHTLGIDRIINRFKVEVLIILLATVIMLLKIVIGDVEGIRGVIFFFIIPALVSILLGSQEEKVIAGKLSRVVLTFFVVECFLAIYERVSLINVFPYDVDWFESNVEENLGFRSTAFLGHPLANALCVSTIMGFILASTRSFSYKLLLVLIGYVALMSFNARGALMIWSILLGMYLLFVYFKEKPKDRYSFFPVLILVVAPIIIYQLIVQQNFGDRFFLGILIDGSAMTRINIMDAFSYMSVFDYLFGNTANTFELLNGQRFGGYENSYIVLITSYGIVPFIIAAIIYYIWIGRLISFYKISHKFLIILSFVFVGSMNNSLATSMPWIYFIICSYAFRVSPLTKNPIESIHQHKFKRVLRNPSSS